MPCDTALAPLSLRTRSPSGVCPGPARLNARGDLNLKRCRPLQRPVSVSFQLPFRSFPRGFHGQDLGVEPASTSAHCVVWGIGRFPLQVEEGTPLRGVMKIISESRGSNNTKAPLDAWAHPGHAHGGWYHEDNVQDARRPPAAGAAIAQGQAHARGARLDRGASRVTIRRERERLYLAS